MTDYAELIDAANNAFHRAYELENEVEALRKDLESHKRMLLAAAVSMGSIGEMLGLDMDSDGDEMLGMVAELKAKNEALLGQHGRDSGELRKLCAARDSARRQRDKLRVDNDALKAAASQSIKFVAFAFDQGIEGAEQAGLAIENALGGAAHG